MYILSEIIRKGLTETTAVTDIVADKVYPLIADQEVELPYVVYSVAKNGAEISKDGGGDFTVTLLSYETTYNKALLLNEAVITALEEVDMYAVNYRFTDQGALPQVTVDQNIFVEQTITIKI